MMPTKEQIKQQKETLEMFNESMDKMKWDQCEQLVLQEKQSDSRVKMFRLAVEKKNLQLCENLLNKSQKLVKDENTLVVIVLNNQISLLNQLLKKDLPAFSLSQGLHHALVSGKTECAQKIIPYCPQIVLNTGFGTAIAQQKEEFIKMFLPICRYRIFLQRYHSQDTVNMLQRYIEEYESEILNQKLTQELKNLDPKISRKKSKL